MVFRTRDALRVFDLIYAMTSNSRDKNMCWRARVSPSRALQPGDPVTLGIRPEHVSTGSDGHRACVGHVEQLGEHSHVYLDLPGSDTPLLVKTQRDDIALGDTLAFRFDEQALHVFDAQGIAPPRRRDEGAPSAALPDAPPVR